MTLAVRTLVSTAWRDVARLVLPVACGGCGTPDVPWCAACAPALEGTAVRCDQHAGRLDPLDGTTLLPVWAPAVFVDPVRRAVSAWKDGGRADLDAPFAAAVHRAALVAAGLVRGDVAAGDVEGRSRGPRPDRDPSAPLLVVAVPSSGRARRRRGRAPVERLAVAAVAGARRAGVLATADPRVLVRSGGADLAGLSARARAAAVDGRVRLHGRRPVAGRAVLLVDDVLTTGATLAACHRALVGGGAHVVGAVVLAATPPPARGRPPAFVRPEQREDPDAG